MKIKVITSALLLVLMLSSAMAEEKNKPATSSPNMQMKKIAEAVLFQPQKSSYKTSSDLFKLTVENGEKIACLYFSSPKAKYTMIYSHGNAEDIGNCKELCKKYSKELNVNVIAYDYRGYGLSDGSASEKNAKNDIECVYNYLIKDKKLKPEQIIVYGRSLGSGTAVHLAAKHKIKATITEGAFTSAVAAAFQMNPFNFDLFENIKSIDKIECPLLLIHAEKDQIINYSHAKKLLQAAKEPKTLLTTKGGHNDLITSDSKKYWDGLKKFIHGLK